MKRHNPSYYATLAILFLVPFLSRCGSDTNDANNNVDRNGRDILSLSTPVEEEEGVTLQLSTRAASVANDAAGTLNFGTSAVPVNATLTITNNSDAGITAVYVTSNNSFLGGKFIYTTTGVFPGSGGTCGTTLAQGASCTLKLTFIPRGTGTNTTVLKYVFDYSGATKWINVRLNGVASAAGCVLGASGFAGGKGTVSNPYQIATATQLDNVSCNRGRHFILTANLDMTGRTFSPIGDDLRPFIGTFDGQGNTISNLRIFHSKGANPVGLFGYTNNATISDLVLDDLYVVGREGPVGGLVGSAANTTISDITISGTTYIRGTTYVGGAIGFANAVTASNFTVDGDVVGGASVGGAFGQWSGNTATNIVSSADVSGINSVGGVVGVISSGTISNSDATGTVTATTSEVGGFAGFIASATLSDCDATGNVTGSANVGALVGLLGSTATISNSSTASGVVTGTGANIGGLVGGAGGGSIISNSGTCTGTAFGGGTGTVNDPFLIDDATDLSNVACMMGKNYRLTQNIDMDGVSMPPIGTSSNSLVGIFDGNGRVISNYTYSAASSDYVGLFAAVGSTGQIKNLGVTNVNITGRHYVGGVVGYVSNLSTHRLTGLYSTGSVTGTNYVGGVVGYLTGSDLVHSYSTADVAGALSVGGLVGELSNGSTLSHSYASGDVTASSSNAGGLTGYIDLSFVNHSYATGEVNGSGSNTGGLSGRIASGHVFTSYATGDVSGAGMVGGLVGQVAGGAVGSSFSSGAVSGTSNVGGLVGSVSSSVVTDSFWDTTTSGQGSSAGGTGYNTADMQTQATFANWEFSNVWAISGGNYPSLRHANLCANLTGLAGSGTVGSPYLISSIEDLMNFQCYPRSSYFRVTNHLNLANVGMFPLGTQTQPFSGTFEGNNKTISNFSYVNTKKNSAGFFGLVNGGTVKDLTLTTATVTALSNVGGLVGHATSATITNCSSSGTITVGANGNGGGVIGYAGSPTLTTVSSSATVSSTDSGNSVGGLVGYMSGGTVTSCSATGNVSGDDAVAGLIGNMLGVTVTLSHATGSVTATGGSVGGLVGQGGSGGSITKSYATGNVSGTNNIGGLAGYLYSNSAPTVANCYARGSATASGNTVGGLIGYHNSTVDRSYATGAVSGSTAGGLIGTCLGHAGAVTRSHWDTTTTGQGTSQGGTGSNTATMQTEATFTNWDFTTIWQITGGNYPTLR